MNKHSLVQLRSRTKEQLKSIGSKGQTYDEVISQLIKIKGKSLNDTSSKSENPEGSH
jgi:hypothetical protein